MPADEMDRLLGYISERSEVIRYPEFLDRGWQIGSGPIEAQYKTTSIRVTGSGKCWDGPNAEAVMALACLENSCLWETYWLTVVGKRIGRGGFTGPGSGKIDRHLLPLLQLSRDLSALGVAGVRSSPRQQKQ